MKQFISFSLVPKLTQALKSSMYNAINTGMHWKLENAYQTIKCIPSPVEHTHIHQFEIK